MAGGLLSRRQSARWPARTPNLIGELASEPPNRENLAGPMADGSSGGPRAELKGGGGPKRGESGERETRPSNPISARTTTGRTRPRARLPSSRPSPHPLPASSPPSNAIECHRMPVLSREASSDQPSAGIPPREARRRSTPLENASEAEEEEEEEEEEERRGGA
ncbi:hypothetical protein KM043_003865 [Ampulex compressa]|nr:hypothetical protein KM043_003865 [Ampulex compressa]